MFIPVHIEPEVGELAQGYSLPYLEKGNVPQIDYVRGIIEKTNTEKRELLINGTKKWIPFHRIISFSFGGIELENTQYDNSRRYNEDQRIIKNLLGRK